MENLIATSSKTVFDIKRDRALCSLKEPYVVNRPKVHVFTLKKIVHDVGFLHMKNINNQPIYSSSSQAKFDSAEFEIILQEKSEFLIVKRHQGGITYVLDVNKSRRVHVRFQLQRKCLFGEQIFIVGDHFILGSWDPQKAIPLTWSDGHLWSVDIDLPVEKPVKFKFILRDNKGKISWQPGPDRVIRVWESKNTIIVCEDWKKAKNQKIIVESESSVDEPVHGNASEIADNIVKEPKLKAGKKVSNVALLEKSAKNNVQENMDGAPASSFEEQGEEEVEGSLITEGEAGPVLVPGLNTPSAASNEKKLKLKRKVWDVLPWIRDLKFLKPWKKS